MTKEEEVLVEKALSSKNPTQTIGETCRKIVMNRIDSMDNVHRELRFMVKDIVDASNFGCEVKLEEAVRMQTVDAGKPDLRNSIIWGSVSAIALIAYLISNRVGLRNALVVASIISSFVAGRSLAPGRSVSVATKVARLVAVTTVKEIGLKIDKFTSSLMALFDYNQIESSHKEFLRWLQSQYADTESQELQRSISRLLDRFKYQLVDYTDGMIESFEVSEANIPAAMTTVPALVRKDNGRLILKGRYLLPKA